MTDNKVRSWKVQAKSRLKAEKLEENALTKNPINEKTLTKNLIKTKRTIKPAFQSPLHPPDFYADRSKVSEQQVKNFRTSQVANFRTGKMMNIV